MNKKCWFCENGNDINIICDDCKKIAATMNKEIEKKEEDLILKMMLEPDNVCFSKH